MYHIVFDTVRNQ